MVNEKILLRFLTAFLCFFSILAWTFYYKEEDTRLTVAFLNIGQGDAIFIESPNGNQMLIDGGPNRSILRELPKVMPFYDRSIDVVLSTHPDKDHIAGLPEVLKRYKVETVLKPGVSSHTVFDEAFQEAVAKEGALEILARRGMILDFGDGVRFDILFPDGDVEGWETNDASIVGKISFGNNAFLLTGDSPAKIEHHLVSLNKEVLQSTVLKVGHHGSKTSTSEEYLDAVHPEYAIISAGKDNSYGHPHEEVIDRLNAKHAKILSTMDLGTIIMKSDGQNLSVTTKN